jgi:isochorismate synthase
MKQTATDFFNEIVSRHFPFVIYRLPKEHSYNCVVNKGFDFSYAENNSGYIQQKGFLIAPFIESHQSPKVFIKPESFFQFKSFDEIIDVSLHESAHRAEKNTDNNFENETNESDFQNQVADTVEKIKNGDLKKAVLSAITIYNVEQNFQPIQLFEKLCRQYPDVFVYIINTPQTGCWIGASPELLMKFDEHHIESISLAGTRFDSGKNGKTIWGEKEINEQQLVTQHIQSSFENNFTEPLEISETKTISTGHLLHLRTDFRIGALSKFSADVVAQFLSNLHPTPAIAGSPKAAAIEHILNTEKHQRDYYTGYLGPIGLHDASHLFVNLRCLKFVKDKLIIYTGAGITADSVPGKEWEEVKLKTQTILKVL